MFKMLGAATAAVALSWSSTAWSATILESGVVTEVTDIGSMYFGVPGNVTGSWEMIFKSNGTVMDTLYGVTDRRRIYYAYDDGTEWTYYASMYYDATFRALPGGFSVRFFIPHGWDNRVGPPGSGYRHMESSDATAHLFVTLRPEAGQATPYEISISPAPEPATWAILSTGFGLAGSALRRSRRRAAPA